MGHGKRKNNTGISWHYWTEIKWPDQILTSCILNLQRKIFSKMLCQLPKGRNLAKYGANWFHPSCKPVEIWHKVSVPDWGWMFIPVCSGRVTRLTFSQQLHLILHTKHTTRVAARVLITPTSYSLSAIIWNCSITTVITHSDSKQSSYVWLSLQDYVLIWD